MVATKQKRSASAKQVATSYFEAVGARDLDAMMDHWAPGGRGYIYGIVDLTVPDTYGQWFGNLFRAFPDFRFEVLEIVAYGEKAAVRWRATGTFDGPARFEGLSPNGASVEVEGFDLLTIRDGKIQENLAYTNGAEMARQLGALPPQGSVAERAMLGATNVRTAALGLVERLRSR